MSDKTAIVIGSTGLVGGHLIELLCESNQFSRIVSLSRRPIDHSSTKIESYVVDFDDLSDYANLFSGDALFSCLGTTRKQAGSISAQREVDLVYQYQAALLAKAQGVSHYLLVSSSGANSSSLSPYFRMKGELEDKVTSLSFAATTILQPSLLLGKRRDLRLGERVASYLLPLITTLPGLSKFRPIEGLDVARKLFQCSDDPKVMRQLRLRDVFPGASL